MSLANTIQTQKAIAHPVRLRILSMLREGPLCGCQISAVVKLAASTVSEHLSELKKAGLVAEKKDGRWVEFRLAPSGSAEAVLSALFSEIDDDPEVRADQVLTKALRRVPLEELCGVGNDLSRLERPAVASAVERSERIREEAGV
jgi:ArsR family transcriptional regulator, arsenate/arsenite/antimonite-responsive transcriptional repressor